MTVRKGNRCVIRLGRLFISLLIFAALIPCTPSVVFPERPAPWAVRLDNAGLPNAFKVSDALYRGAQPTREGFLELKRMGIKTVINLREHHSDAELIRGTGLRYFRIPMSAVRPRRTDFDRFLRIVQRPELQPVFVHCMRGADRTGAVVALYRMYVQHWDADEAVKELRDGGYGYNPQLREIIVLVRSYGKGP